MVGIRVMGRVDWVRVHGIRVHDTAVLVLHHARHEAVSHAHAHACGGCVNDQEHDELKIILLIWVHLNSETAATVAMTSMQ